MNEPRPGRIGILGHVGNGNLGDEAIISVVIQNIKRRWPSAEIRCFTSNPEDTRQRHGVTAFPIRRIDAIEGRATADNRGKSGLQETTWLSRLLGRVRIALKSVSLVYLCAKGFQRTWDVLRASLKEPRFLLQCHRSLRGIDLLIVAGSQQLIDYVADGPWNHPYTLFKWVLLAKARKARVAFMSVGAGPVQSAVGRFFIRNCLLLADYRSYRDEVSSKCIEQIGVLGQDPVFPDLAYSLCVKEEVPDAHSSLTRPCVGINPLPFSDPRYWVGGSVAAYDIYVREIAGFASWLIQSGHAVLFFPTQLRADPPVIEDIRMCMRETATPGFEQHIVDYPVHTLDDLASAISMADVTVATRYHGVVISYLLNKPVLGIAYASKTSDLMEQMGQGEFAVNILQCEQKSLQERFISLEARKTAIKKEIFRRISIFRQALDAQYDEVFRLLERNRA